MPTAEPEVWLGGRGAAKPLSLAGYCLVALAAAGDLYARFPMDNPAAFTDLGLLLAAAALALKDASGAWCRLGLPLCAGVAAAAWMTLDAGLAQTIAVPIGAPAGEDPWAQSLVQTVLLLLLAATGALPRSRAPSRRAGAACGAAATALAAAVLSGDVFAYLSGLQAIPTTAQLEIGALILGGCAVMRILTPADFGSGNAGRIRLLGAGLIAVAFFAWAVLSWIDYHRSIAFARHDSETMLRTLDEHARRTLDPAYVLNGMIAGRVRALGLEPVVGSADEWQRVVDALAATPQIKAIGIADATGRLRRITTQFPIPPDVDVGDRDYYRAVRDGDGDSYIGLPLRGRVSGTQVFPVSRKLAGPDGAFLGVVFASIETSYFRNYYQQLRQTPATMFALFRASGELLARAPEAEWMVGRAAPRSHIFGEFLKKNAAAFTLVKSPIDGVHRAMSYLRSEALPLVVMGGIDYARVIQEWLSRLILHAVGLVAFIVVVLRLVGRHARAIEALTGSEAKYRLLAEHGRDLIARISPAGEVLYVSPSLHSELGYAPEEVIGRSLFEFFHPDDRERVRAAHRRVLATGEANTLDYRIRAKNGRHIWFQRVSRLVPDGITGPEVIVQTRNIHARKEAEDLLQERERRYREVVQDQAEFICRCGADDRVTFANPAFARAFGVAPDDLCGRYLPALFEGAEAVARTTAVGGLSAGRPLVRIEQQLRLADGSRRWHEWDIRGMFGEEGDLCEIQSVGRDVTERRAAEEAVKVHEAWFRRLADSVPVIIWGGGGDGTTRLDYINRTGLDFLGLPLSKVLAEGWSNSVHPDDREVALTAWRQAIAARSDFSVIFRARRYDGAWRWQSVVGVPRLDKDGRHIGHIGTTTDITDLILARDEVAHHSEVLRTIVDAVPDALLLANACGQIVLANPAVAQMWGMPQSDLIGGATSRLGNFDDDEAAQVRRYGRRDGTTFLGESIVRQLGGAAGGMGVLRIVRDVTAAVETNLALESARQSAEEANSAKTRFLAAASHDLRQPLHALNLFVDSLSRRVPLHSEQSALVADVQASLASLDEMFAQLLDISRLDAGVVPLQRQVVPIRRVMQALGAQLKPLALERDLRLRIVPSDAVVMTDPVLLERILRNLIVNAIRNTERGSILVGCRHRGGRLWLEVWDSGRGIPADQLERIFDEFYRVKAGGEDRRGLGLGLTIVKRLAGMLDHPVEVASRAGRGSVFRVGLPLGDAAAVVAPEADAASLGAGNLEGRRVAVIDDDATVLRSTRRMLEDWGCVVIAAQTVDQLMRELAEVPDVELLVADYQLDLERTGLDVVELVRDVMEAELPAIIITADTDPQVMLRARALNCRLLHKPLRPMRMRSLITVMLNPFEAMLG